jgi:hypothetical protein
LFLVGPSLWLVFSLIFSILYCWPTLLPLKVTNKRCFRCLVERSCWGCCSCILCWQWYKEAMGSGCIRYWMCYSSPLHGICSVAVCPHSSQCMTAKWTCIASQSSLF